MTLDTPAGALAYQVTRDRKAFADAARDAAELAVYIAKSPAEHVGGDLSRLSQQVTTLVGQAAKIKAALETAELLKTAAARVTEK
ncbi:hypothetical protein AB0B04_18980 [Streptomyces xinghaiensis]|uniref:Uncharacterized protein n=2 Tax=Streptomyces TaxID=1883 RepID=A0A3R7EML8_9ACTN|nr:MULTISPECIES: hypothetical protein [Streptomyces]KNE83291.1 hypothetical protein ADZ36_05465 [Streptomyces fradiae]OFA36636.1 hypothetical protein BEN35_29715 [Streptomyces fradiae]PQM20634.1 hypothetical protein Sfr7A_25960 [Streptomyces xinghaiensis]RKM92575.1 hypothetical protein SFRA_024615 [Streptomyces xinghaiensis]RNC70543.1 hypothetical protein DC095_025605 [Streptomyces xinghaiensis]